MLFVFGFGFVIGAVLGAFIVALAAAADKEVPREPATIRLYSPNRSYTTRGDGAYRIMRLRAGDNVGIVGQLTEDEANAAFGWSDR
jgi:hypothetical protein